MNDPVLKIVLNFFNSNGFKHTLFFNQRWSLKFQSFDDVQALRALSVGSVQSIAKSNLMNYVLDREQDYRKAVTVPAE